MHLVSSTGKVTNLRANPMNSTMKRTMEMSKFDEELKHQFDTKKLKCKS